VGQNPGDGRRKSNVGPFMDAHPQRPTLNLDHSLARRSRACLHLSVVKTFGTEGDVI
jgi:hypothetical protein